jgi:hypothetical protein
VDAIDGLNEGPELKLKWPEGQPYKGLPSYQAADRLLFSGRTREVEICVQALEDPRTRILLLHGTTGCGKSSFLRAGLIPGLEERGRGFQFLREAHTETKSARPVFIQCGADPIGRIAEYIFKFVEKPFVVEDNVTSPEEYNLLDARLGHTSIAAFVEHCHKPGALIESLRKLSRPATFILILDQAEQVLTLAGEESSSRRQFFRFVKEFATTSFPTKFVIALRKDYSGEFIGQTLLGGSLALSRGTEDSSSSPLPSPANVDIKIFLLGELSTEAVVSAITLPTSDKPVGRYGAPRPVYKFFYQEGVVRRIVDGLFDVTSGIAVLPVMQLVCKDLYTRARKAIPKDSEAQVTWQQYIEGGEISGPVDRYISESLRAAFDKTLNPNTLAAEEDRARQLLFNLVRRDPDQSIHTSQLSIAALRTRAKDLGVMSDVDSVIDVLSRDDVSLLRVSADPGSAHGEEPTGNQAANEAKVRSAASVYLGHDFIGVVLQQWHDRRVAAQEAESVTRAQIAEAHVRIAKAQEEKMRAMRRAMWVVLASIATVIVAVIAMLHGQLSTKISVLRNAAISRERQAPMAAMSIAAQGDNMASGVWKRTFLLWTLGVPKAHDVLAEIISGLPDKTLRFPLFPSEDVKAKPTLAGSPFIAPLRRSHRFIYVDGTHVEIVGPDKSMSVSLDQEANGDGNSSGMTADSPAGSALAQPRVTSGVSESETGDIWVLQQRGDPLQQNKHHYEVYAISPDYKVTGPFGIEDFAKELRGWTAGTGMVQGLDTASMFLGGQTVQILEFTDGGIMLAVFGVVNEPKESRDRFKLLYQGPLIWKGRVVNNLDGHLVAAWPETTEQGAVYHVAPVLGTTWEEKPVDSCKLSTESEPRQCQWLVFPPDSSDELLVIGKVRPTLQTPEALAGALIDDLANFERLIFVNGRTGETVKVSLSDLGAKCPNDFPNFRASDRQEPALKSSLLSAGQLPSLTLGVRYGSSVHLVRLQGSAPASCLGALYFLDSITAWAGTRDRPTIMASGPSVGVEWDQIDAISANQAVLAKRPGLIDTACAHGMAGNELTESQWKEATALDPMPQLCRVPGNQPSTSADAHNPVATPSANH